MNRNKPIEQINEWFKHKSWQPFSFQTEAWQAYLEGKSGLIHSSTGSGKTFAIWPAPLIEWMEENKDTKKQMTPLTVLWLTPLRALASDTRESLYDLVEGLNLPWSIEIRTSDTSSAIKLRQKNKMPSCLITTPESLELLLSYEEHQNQLKNLKLVVVDEWHELLSTKRGTMTELALARLRKLNPSLRVWGMSATLSNLDESLKTLASKNAVLISSDAFTTSCCEAPTLKLPVINLVKMNFSVMSNSSQYFISLDCCSSSSSFFRQSNRSSTQCVSDNEDLDGGD